MADPRNDCHSCPDSTRVRRGCPKPLREPYAYASVPRPPAPDCPVLDIPAWYHEVIYIGREIEDGRIGRSDLAARDYQLSVFAWSEHRGAHVARKEAEKKRKDLLRQLLT